MKRSTKAAMIGSAIAGAVAAHASGNVISDSNNERAIKREFTTEDMVSKLATLSLQHEAVIITSSADARNATEFAKEIGISSDNRPAFIEQIQSQGKGNFYASTDYVVPKEYVNSDVMVPKVIGQTDGGAPIVQAELDESRNVIAYYVPSQEQQ